MPGRNFLKSKAGYFLLYEAARLVKVESRIDWDLLAIQLNFI
jgi:hypothetical protein